MERGLPLRALLRRRAAPLSRRGASATELGLDVVEPFSLELEEPVAELVDQQQIGETELARMERRFDELERKLDLLLAAQSRAGAVTRAGDRLGTSAGAGLPSAVGNPVRENS